VNTLTRTYIISSSNANLAVSFTAGTKDIFITAPASRFLQKDNVGNVGNFTAGTITATIAGTATGLSQNLPTTRLNSGIGADASTFWRGDSTWVTPPVYTHPTNDGNLHVPATSTTNNGKVLTAGAAAGALSWATPTVGTVTSFAFTSANGITGSVSNSTTVPTLSFTLGAVTGTSFNGITGLSSSTPLIEGVAAAGSGTAAARSDHVHPSSPAIAQLGLIWENETVMSTNYSLTANKNGFMVGPLTVNSGITFTVPSGQRMVIV
jgi:hypothetical protein